jgi:hypothetical protein
VRGARYLGALTHAPYVTADQTRGYGVADVEVETLNTVGYKTVKAQFWNYHLQTVIYLDTSVFAFQQRRATISLDYHEIPHELIGSVATLIHFTSHERLTMEQIEIWHE